MRRRIQRRLPPAGQEGSTGAATTVAVSERNDQTELEEVNALYSMLEDRYKKKVCRSIGIPSWKRIDKDQDPKPTTIHPA